ncbi:MAG TPA: hypothetical protein VLH80_07590 [Nitrospiraceae bacterium]|nr:hypothetical protein [Nitrospiraceae bacterium]
MKTQKFLQWLAVGYIALLALCFLCVIGVLLFLFFKSVFNDWGTWLKVCGAIAVIAAGQWAQSYLSDHGVPWNTDER